MTSITGAAKGRSGKAGPTLDGVCTGRWIVLAVFLAGTMSCTQQRDDPVAAQGDPADAATADESQDTAGEDGDVADTTVGGSSTADSGPRPVDPFMASPSDARVSRQVDPADVVMEQTPQDVPRDRPADSFDTPQATFATLQAAADREDWRTFCDCLTDDCRDLVAAGLLLIGDAMQQALRESLAEADERGMTEDEIRESRLTLEALHAIYDEHGVDGPDRQPLQLPPRPTQEVMNARLTASVAHIADRTQFIADMFPYLQKFGDRSGNRKLLDIFVIRDLEVGLDTAEATIVSVADETQSSPIRFTKIDDAWKVDWIELNEM